MSDAILELRGLHRRFGAHVAVAGIDLALRRSEFLTFLGPSGSGKTTTLMMVAGLQAPDGGSILLDGQNIDRLPPWKRDIGMVFQHYALFPHMSVARNVAFPLEMRRMPAREIDRLVAATLALVGLADFAARLPRQLSGGQQQRVALARAMVYGPALLLMDEPLGALDRKLREQLQLEIKRVHRARRMSVLYVTHDQEEALTMSDRIAVFNQGRIEQVGTPAELYEAPATRFVAGFIGDSNFLPGRLLQAGAGQCTVEVAGVTTAAAWRGAPGAAGAVVVAIRPERMRLDTAPDGAGLAGRVVDVIYLGHARRTLLRLEDGQECQVLEPPGAAEARALAPGQAVRLSWDGVHATAFLG